MSSFNSADGFANAVQICDAPTGANPLVLAMGADTNVSLDINTQGNGKINLKTGNSADFLQVQNVTGNGIIYAAGSSATIGVILVAKGTGGVYFESAGNFAGYFQNPANPVNYFAFTGAATGSGVQVATVGTDTDVDLKLTCQGAGRVDFHNANALIALGGGAAPTLGTIGATGPATAGQNSWLRMKINGTDSFIPVWR